MEYIEGFVVAVPTTNKEAYIQYAREAAVVLDIMALTRSERLWHGKSHEGLSHE